MLQHNIEKNKKESIYACVLKLVSVCVSYYIAI